MAIYRSPWPPQPLDTEHTQADYDLQMEHARVPAGNAATLHGYVTGQSEVAGEAPPSVPHAPGHGLPAHDHSGGDYGRPLFRSIYSLNGGDLETFGGGFVSQQQNHVTFSEGALIDGIFVRSQAASFQSFAVYIPGCDTRTGAYAYLGISAAVKENTANTLLAADTLTLVIQNLTHNSSTELDLDPASGGVEHVASDGAANPTELLATVPGRINHIRAIMTASLTGTGGARAVNVTLTELELGVYEV